MIRCKLGRVQGRTLPERLAPLYEHCRRSRICHLGGAHRGEVQAAWNTQGGAPVALALALLLRQPRCTPGRKVPPGLEARSPPTLSDTALACGRSAGSVRARTQHVSNCAHQRLHEILGSRINHLKGVCGGRSCSVWSRLQAAPRHTNAPPAQHHKFGPTTAPACQATTKFVLEASQKRT